MKSFKNYPATHGHTYAFRLIRGGWLNSGLVADDKRAWWANYWMTNADESGGSAQGQRAARVAFVPFCDANSNWLSQAAIDCDAVHIIGTNVENSR